MLGRDVKKADTEQVIPVQDPQVCHQVGQLAKQIFKALGARDYGRVDIRMDASGQPYFLEANLVPGLGGGYFTRACRINQGLSYEDTILSIVELAFARQTELIDEGMGQDGLVMPALKPTSELM